MTNSNAIKTVLRIYAYKKVADIMKLFPCHTQFVIVRFDYFAWLLKVAVLNEHSPTGFLRKCSVRARWRHVTQKYKGDM